MSDTFYNNFLPHGKERLDRIANFEIEISMVARDGKEEFCFNCSEAIVIQYNTYQSIIEAVSKDMEKAPEDKPGYRAELVRKLSSTFKKLLTTGVIKFEDETFDPTVFIADNETFKLDDDQKIYKIVHGIHQVN